MKAFDKVRAPKGISKAVNNLKEGFIYNVFNLNIEGACVSFNIKDEDGIDIFCLLKRCAHLGNRNWIVPRKQN